MKYYTYQAPDSLIIKDNKNLLDKLRKGIEDTDNGKVCSVEETYQEIKKILTD